LLPQVGGLVDLLQVEQHRPAGLARQRHHPFGLGRHVDVVAGHLEHAVAFFAQHAAQAEQLVAVGKSAGHQLAVGAAVDQCARGGKAEGPGTQGAAQLGRHGGDVGRRGHAVVWHAALAHRVHPQCAMRHLRACVNRRMSSTPSIRPISQSRRSGLTGAKPTPQLPIITVVTPCHDDGRQEGSQVTWPSQWVCTSTQPGVTSAPSATISRRPRPALPPTWLMRPPSTATSPAKRGAPLPSTTVPPRMTRSCMGVVSVLTVDALSPMRCPALHHSGSSTRGAPMLTRSRLLRAAALTAASLALPMLAAAQAAFPIAGKPMRIIVPFPAGGQTDVQARMLASKLQPALGVPVVVENKPGASTILGVQDLLRSPPDGHTLLYTITVTAGQNPHLFSKLPYDATKDLVPVMFAARSSTVLIVPAASPFNSVKDLVEHAKANPGKLNYASFSLGSTSHLVAEMLQHATGTQMTHVPFKGSADAGVALIGGQVDFLFDGPTTALNYAKAGKVKMLAFTDPKPYRALGNLPNMAQAGYPGVDVSGGMQFFGPRGLAPDVVAKVNAALAAALKQPEVEKMFVDGGTEIVASSPAEHAAVVKDLYDKFGEVIRRIGLKLD
jgi:tripartite-type tricarboxylate transporter receptor subunit TctC